MAKSKTKGPKRKRKRGFPPAAEPETPSPSPVVNSGLPEKPPIRWGLVVLFLTISLGGCYLFLLMMDKGSRYTYEVIKTYPHDEKAFTQGLFVDEGFLWESTGRYGESSVRKIELETGKIVDRTDLSKDYFGEGLAVSKDQIYQLTWKAGKAFVYNRDLDVVKEFEYEGQGWGLTQNTDGSELILSNGTAEIKFIDPATFKVKRSIWVKRKGGLSAGQLNELEYFGGRIYANKYQTDLIYEIHPDTGKITGEIDLSGLWPTKDRPVDGVLNGIAVNPETKRFLVTGKMCPYIYELRVFPKE